MFQPRPQHTLFDHTHMFHANKVYIYFFFSPLQFFHFSSRAFLPPDGQFVGRIQWKGVPARGEASISLINATLKDNGTYTCSVRNPPDVHGSPTSHTVLTVTPKGTMVHACKKCMILNHDHCLSSFHLRCLDLASFFFLSL